MSGVSPLLSDLPLPDDDAGMFAPVDASSMDTPQGEGATPTCKGKNQFKTKGPKLTLKQKKKIRTEKKLEKSNRRNYHKSIENQRIETVKLQTLPLSAPLHFHT